MTTSEGGSDRANLKLNAALDVIKATLETRQHLDSTRLEQSQATNQIIETWLRFTTEIEVPNRKILRITQPDKLSFRVEIFCLTEESVKDLWGNFHKDQPIATALHKALHASEVWHETCEVYIKSEVNNELVGSVVLTSEEYVKLVTSIITRRRKEQDRKWTTTHGAERDKKIAQEIEVTLEITSCIHVFISFTETTNCKWTLLQNFAISNHHKCICSLQSRRLERKWEAILDEARGLMGERSVQALEKAREEYDNDAEFIAQIEASMKTGNFMQFLKDLISNLCRVM